MISVCMTTHNGEKYISEQIDSILCQLGSEDELIISDDGSTDKTCDIINQYNDYRIKLIKFTQPIKYNDNFSTHRYASKNFENALKHAKGDYIFLCDQDDIWMPNKVQLCIDALKNSILVKHNGLRINEIGESLQSESTSGSISKNLFINIIKLNIPGSHIAFKRELLRLVLPFPQKLICHDAWIGCLAQSIGQSTYLDIPLIKYRIHSNNVSVHKRNSLLVKLSYRIELFVEVIYRILNYKNRK